MGVSLFMKVKTSPRVFSQVRNITPGSRSKAASILSERFGPFPLRIEDDELPIIETLAAGASLYTGDADNFWLIIAVALREYGAVEIEAEY